MNALNQLALRRMRAKSPELRLQAIAQLREDLDHAEWLALSDGSISYRRAALCLGVTHTTVIYRLRVLSKRYAPQDQLFDL